MFGFVKLREDKQAVWDDFKKQRKRNMVILYALLAIIGLIILNGALYLVTKI